jgi:hypothetical protein
MRQEKVNREKRKVEKKWCAVAAHHRRRLNDSFVFAPFHSRTPLNNSEYVCLSQIQFTHR